MSNEIFETKAYEEAKARYSGPRMHAGVSSDREMTAFVEGAIWAARQTTAKDSD